MNVYQSPPHPCLGWADRPLELWIPLRFPSLCLTGVATHLSAAPENRVCNVSPGESRLNEDLISLLPCLSLLELG